MADDADVAQSQIELNIDCALAKIKHYKGTSSEFCEECGEPIPEARRNLLPGITICVDCAELAERLNRVQI